MAAVTTRRRVIGGQPVREPEREAEPTPRAERDLQRQLEWANEEARRRGLK